MDDHNNEVSEQEGWSMWAVSGEIDDDNTLVTSGSFSPDLGEEWKNWCVEDPECESDFSAEDGRMSESPLLQMKQVLGRAPLGRSFGPL